MALKPTIYKLRMAISDMNRDYYDSFSLTVALHPSETIERMMARIVAFCLNADKDLTFTKGLSEIDEPDIWLKTYDDQIKLWIDMGEPSPDRIKKSSRQASAVKVYSFNSKSDTWWQQTMPKIQAFKNVTYYQLDWSQIQQLATCAERNMDWSVSISGDTVYVAAGDETCELVVNELTF